MPVPSPRNKLLPARGNIATLQANVASLFEGEICYALDEDQYYQKEGGVLVVVGATKAQGALADTALQPGEALPANSGLNALSDVDLVTVPPTFGQVLAYNGTTWAPGTGGGGANALNDLTDVNITTLNGGDVLQYDGNASEWVAAEKSNILFVDDRTINSATAQVMNFTMKAGEMYQAYLRLSSGSSYFSMSSILYSSTPTQSASGADIAYQGTRLASASISSNRPTYTLSTSTNTTCRFTLMKVG